MHLRPCGISSQGKLVLLRDSSPRHPPRIALIGPHAQTHVELAGNYFEGIGLGTCSGAGCIPTLEDALNRFSQAGNVTAVSSCDRKCVSADIISAVAAALASDVVILAMGIDGTIEGEGHDRMDIRLPGQQPVLAQAVISAAKAKQTPVVLLLFNGGMVTLDGIDLRGVAIVECWYPGATGGTAVAETLFGLQNRFGKLPFTAYTYNFTLVSEFTNMNMTDGPGRTYKYLKDESLASYPFGYGLSYTTFALSRPGLGDPTLLVEGPTTATTVNVTVTNTGARRGDEVVFLFHNATGPAQEWASRPLSDGPDPLALKQLIGYQRVTLEAGQAETVSFNVTAGALSTVDKHGTRHVLPGLHHLVLSRGHGASLDISLSATLPPPRKRWVISTMAGFSPETGLTAEEQ